MIDREQQSVIKPTWSVCATARESPQLLEKFVDHHRKLGASQVYLYLDRPDAEMRSWAQKQSGAEITICDESYRGPLNGKKTSHLRFQVANFGHFLVYKCRTQWVAHIDADEFISAESDVSALLGELGHNYDSLQIMPVEPVFRRRLAGPKHAYRQTLARLPLLAMNDAVERLLHGVYGEDAILLRRGLIGHALGKTFIRRGAQLTPLHLHHTRAASCDRHIVADKFVLRLMHYDAVDSAHFGRKISSRLSMSANNMGGGREHLIEKFRAADSSAGGGQRESLFERLYTLDERQIRLLKSRSLLVSIDLRKMQFAPSARPWILACGPGSVLSAEYYARLGYNSVALEKAPGNDFVTEVHMEPSLTGSHRSRAERRSGGITKAVSDFFLRFPESDGQFALAIASDPCSSDGLIKALRKSLCRPLALQVPMAGLPTLESLGSAGYTRFKLSDASGRKNSHYKQSQLVTVDQRLVPKTNPMPPCGPQPDKVAGPWLDAKGARAKWNSQPSHFDTPIAYATSALEPTAPNTATLRWSYKTLIAATLDHARSAIHRRRAFGTQT